MKIGIGILVLALVVIVGYALFPKASAPAPEPEAVVSENQNEEQADSTTEATGTVREFVVEGGMMYFSPNELEVSAGDTVRIVYKNKDGRHDWVIDEFDARTTILGPGEEQTIEFVADRAGTFEFYCSVGNHRAMGMKGTLTVTE